MANVVIVHGTGGSPEGNWFPWLKSELEGYGCQVFVPRFPTPLGQSLEKWLEIFNEYERYLNKDAIIVGHSLGTAFLLSVLERIDHPVRAAYFVAGFTGLLDNPDFDVLNRTFTVKAFDWNKIKRNCMHFYVINSDNDPYVPVQKGIDLARDLNVEPAVLRNAGHINRDSGYVEFGFLAKSIREEIKN
jgi:hypothetical protein